MDLCPASMEEEIDAMNNIVYNKVNRQGCTPEVDNSRPGGWLVLRDFVLSYPVCLPGGVMCYVERSESCVECNGVSMLRSITLDSLRGAGKAFERCGVRCWKLSIVLHQRLSTWA